MFMICLISLVLPRVIRSSLFMVLRLCLTVVMIWLLLVKLTLMSIFSPIMLGWRFRIWSITSCVPVMPPVSMSIRVSMVISVMFLVLSVSFSNWWLTLARFLIGYL